MAHIEHRPRVTPAAPMSMGRLPVVGRLFLLWALLAAISKLWPVADALLAGVTEWWSGIPDLLAPAARSAALVALPAAVAWARPAASRANPWLWKGAVIAALVELARIAADALGRTLTADGEQSGFLATFAISLLLGVAGALGTWALSEGLRDAGARVGRRVLVLIAVGVIAVLIVAFGPTLLAGGGDAAEMLLNAGSAVVNGLFLLAAGILAATTAAGAVQASRPRDAWRAGAVAAAVLLGTPLISIAVIVVGQLVRLGDVELLGRVLTILSFFGWPLFAIAVASGMGRLPRRSVAIAGSGRRFDVTGQRRYTATTPR